MHVELHCSSIIRVIILCDLICRNQLTMYGNSSENRDRTIQIYQLYYTFT